MNLKKEIISGSGFVIAKIPDLKKFEYLRETFLNKMNLDGEKDIFVLRKKIAKMKNHEINKAMVNLLSFNEASEIMIKSCKKIVEELCGKELLIQRRANTIFNLPGEDQRRQWPHYELMSGISPYTFIMWAPFHDLDDDGGVYYVPQNKSYEIIKKEHSLGLVNGPTILDKMNTYKPAKLKFGEVIVFNPFVLHGNVDFNSDLARIACSVRFQSKHKPIMQKDSDFFKLYKLK
jgi:sporadic carbohydrate cluster 2OG-Fe(II) oxygenase